ncbi:hypothetical protein HD554DRAFT_2079935, partial [Boletus coccyginus]
MPQHVVSNDTKLNIPTLSEDGYTMKEICYLLGIKKTHIYKTFSLYKQFGIVYNPYTYPQYVICNVVAHRNTI